jgi:hypothetical protein
VRGALYLAACGCTRLRNGSPSPHPCPSRGRELGVLLWEPRPRGDRTLQFAGGRGLPAVPSPLWGMRGMQASVASKMELPTGAIDAMSLVDQPSLATASLFTLTPTLPHRGGGGSPELTHGRPAFPRSPHPLPAQQGRQDSLVPFAAAFEQDLSHPSWRLRRRSGRLAIPRHARAMVRRSETAAACTAASPSWRACAGC